MSVADLLLKILLQEIAQTDLLRSIDSKLTASPLDPTHFHAEVRSTAMARPRFMGGRWQRGQGSIGVPGGNVNVLFGWDPAADGGVTVAYRLDIFNPDGTLFSSDSPAGTDVSFSKVMPDNTGTFGASLTALASDGTPCVNPATTTFIPHTEAPPQVPGDPTGFGVRSITDAP